LRLSTLYIKENGGGGGVDTALRGNPISELRDVTCHIWDHTVLPATRHKWTRPA